MSRKFRVKVPSIGMFLAAFVSVVLLLSACHPEPPTSARMTLPVPDGVAIFNQQCSTCHDLERSLATSGDEETWRIAIEQMRQVFGTKSSSMNVEEMVAYHVNQQQHETQVFQDDCQRCHAGQGANQQPLNRQQVHALVQSMQQKVGTDISDADAEMIVNYHIREHRSALDRNVRGGLGLDQENLESWQMIGRTVFLEKCSSCHDIQRSIGILKDEKAWEVSLEKMKDFSQGEISQKDINALVDYHVKEQQRELQVFQDTCTTCHASERFTTHSMSDDETLKMLRKMQNLAPDMITDDKVQVLFLFHQRQEKTFATLFDGRCRRCHKFRGLKQVTVDASQQNLSVLVNRANAFFGRSLDAPGVSGLLRFHKEREKREMAVFKNSCESCHESSAKTKKPTREARVMQISILQGRELNRDTKETIRTQIRFHQVEQSRG